MLITVDPSPAALIVEYLLKLSLDFINKSIDHSALGHVFNFDLD
jgi:hypothetical protein